MVQATLSLMEIDNIVISLLVVLVLASFVRRWWFRWDHVSEAEKRSYDANNVSFRAATREVNDHLHEQQDVPVLVANLLPRRPWNTCSWLVQGLVAAGHDVIVVNTMNFVENKTRDVDVQAIIVLAGKYTSYQYLQLDSVRKRKEIPIHLVQTRMNSLRSRVKSKSFIRDLSGEIIELHGRHPELTIVGCLLKRIGFIV